MEQAVEASGKLLIEYPDFDANIHAYIKGDNPEIRLPYIFGRQRFPGDTHRFGYDFRILEKLSEEICFRNIEQSERQDYHSKDELGLRVECT
jgi:hypothetical protein